MPTILIIALSLLLLVTPHAQTCIHEDLSPTFTIITQTKKLKRPYSVIDSSHITIKIVDKASKKTIQEISFGTFELYDGDYAKCRLVRSCTTGKNRNASVTDDDYGDIVVADFNFDFREDIAIKSDNSNAGVHYTFYIQGGANKSIV